jgi:hypothetical protein
MRKNNVNKNSVAIFIDYSDQYYVHLTSSQLQRKLLVPNSKEILLDLIYSETSLIQLKELIE